MYLNQSLEKCNPLPINRRIYFTIVGLATQKLHNDNTASKPVPFNYSRKFQTMYSKLMLLSKVREIDHGKIILKNKIYSLNKSIFLSRLKL